MLSSFFVDFIIGAGCGYCHRDIRLEGESFTSKLILHMYSSCYALLLATKNPSLVRVLFLLYSVHNTKTQYPFLL